MEQLSHLLLLFSQKILGREDENQVGIVQQLLLEIDHYNFSLIFKNDEVKNIQSLLRNVKDYYLKIRSQIIQLSYQSQHNQTSEFVQIYVFIFDLAFHGQQNDKYINTMLNMSSDHLTILHPFVQYVNRRNFILKKQNFDTPFKNQFEKLNYESQYQQLKYDHQQLMKKYQQLKQNYQNLKDEKEKVVQILVQFQSERNQMMNEFGESNLEEIIQKIKRQSQGYEATIQGLNKALEQKKSLLKLKDEEIQHLIKSFSDNQYEQKSKKLNEQIQKNKALDAECLQLKNNEQKLRLQVESLKQLVTKKQNQINRLQKINAERQVYEAKYLAIRSLHSQFKSKITKNFKERQI